MPFVTTEKSNATSAVIRRKDTVELLYNACKVITLDRSISDLLTIENPKGLEQIENAILEHEDPQTGLQSALAALRAEDKRWWSTEEEAANDFSNSINRIGFDNKKFVAKMACEHRTLQQTFTGICLSWLGHLSTLNENQYDARNEHSVKVAKKIADALEDTNYRLDRLPCI